MKNNNGTVGIVVALLAICVAMFQDDLRPAPPPVDEQLKQKVIEKGAKMLGLAVESKEERNRHDYVAVGYTGLGLVALILGVVLYVRQENHRVAGMAGALGIVAIGWEYVLIGVAIAVVIFVLANLHDIFA